MKIFRSYKNLLAATVFFASVIGVAALMLIDGENNLRSPFLNNNFLSRFIEKVGIERIDFSAKGFACFCITYLDVLALFFAMLYSRTLGLYFRIQNRKFNLRLYYFVIILLFTVVFVGSLFFLGMEPYDFLELSIIYAFFFVFFIIAAAAFFLVCTLIAFIHSRIVKEKFSFPVDDELTDLDEVETETPKRSIFPSLTEIDKKYADAKPVKLPACNVLSLKDLTEGFRQYAYSKYSINYNTVRCALSFRVWRCRGWYFCGAKAKPPAVCPYFYGISERRSKCYPRAERMGQRIGCFGLLQRTGGTVHVLVVRGKIVRGGLYARARQSDILYRHGRRGNLRIFRRRTEHVVPQRTESAAQSSARQEGAI